MIGVLCGLFLVALLIGYCYHRGRRNKHTSALVEEAKAVGTRGATNLTYEGDPTSPRSGPASEVTVESGGDAVYEMHGMSRITPTTPSFAYTTESEFLTFLKIHPPSNFQHSSTPPFPRSIHIHNPVRRKASRLQSHHRLLPDLNRGHPIPRPAADAQNRSRQYRPDRSIRW